MLSKDTWHEAATRANLAVGQRRRFGHSCGDGDVVLVTMTIEGLSAYCFRCGDSAFVRRELSLAEKVAHLRARNEAYTEFRTCTLPKDFTLEIPPKYAVWIYKAAVTKAQARQYGFGWSASLHRICIPVYAKDGSLAFMQARAVEAGQQPKYLNSSGASAAMTLFTTDEIVPDKDCIVTEDILSAIRCGKFVPSAALCGTALSFHKMLELAKAKRIICFLDPDKAGQDAMRKFIKKMGLLHGDIRVLKAKKDPKLLTDSELESLIKGLT